MYAESTSVADIALPRYFAGIFADLFEEELVELLRELLQLFVRGDAQGHPIRVRVLESGGVEGCLLGAGKREIPTFTVMCERRLFSILRQLCGMQLDIGEFRAFGRHLR